MIDVKEYRRLVFETDELPKDIALFLHGVFATPKGVAESTLIIEIQRAEARFLGKWVEPK